MAGYTETGYLKIALDVTVMGALPKNKAQKIESDLLDFFKERKVNINGKISFVKIDTLEVENNYNNLDTGTSQ